MGLLEDLLEGTSAVADTLIKAVRLSDRGRKDLNIQKNA